MSGRYRDPTAEELRQLRGVKCLKCPEKATQMAPIASIMLHSAHWGPVCDRCAPAEAKPIDRNLLGDKCGALSVTGSLFSGARLAASCPYPRHTIDMVGKPLTLDDVEHVLLPGIVRASNREPEG